MDGSLVWKDGEIAFGPRFTANHPAEAQNESHDVVSKVRHHAATLTARMPGITTKELMARIGHASPRAALIYDVLLLMDAGDLPRVKGDDGLFYVPLLAVRAYAEGHR